MRAVVAGVLWIAASARAGETSDTSLAREVDRYLEQTAEETRNPTLHPKWRNGLVFESANGDFMVRLRSRLLWDTVWRHTDTVSDGDNNSSFFRQVRFGVRGRVYKNTIFLIEMDFGLGQISFMDVFVGLRRLPVLGTVTLGHQREPFSLDGVTPIPFHAFMERATATNVFAPARALGARAADHLLDDRLTWSAGIYIEDDAPFSGKGDSGGLFVMRVTGLPVRERDTHTILHLGLSFTARDPPNGIARLDGRPGLRIGPVTLDTGPMPADRDLRAAIEIAYFMRSFRVQAEFFVADISGETNATFTGWYLMASWWITGEHANFLAKAATYGRMRPSNNFQDGTGGWGAWEVAFRISYVDLNDGNVIGGRQNDYSLGLNWHWNPHTRFVFNLIFADVANGPLGSGNVWLFKVRVQFDF